ncbi:hypothetical protein Tco_1158535 [Tanacetum coccineum]
MAASDKGKFVDDDSQKGKSMMHVDDDSKSMRPVEDDMDWYNEFIREQTKKVAEGFRKKAYNVVENVMLARDE